MQLFRGVQVFQFDGAESFGSYSLCTFAEDNAVLYSARNESKPFTEWKNDARDSIGIEHVDIVQMLIEPEGVLVHLLDESFCCASVPKNETRVFGYQGEANLRLNLENGTWKKVTEKDHLSNFRPIG